MQAHINKNNKLTDDIITKNIFEDMGLTLTEGGVYYLE